MSEEVITALGRKISVRELDPADMLDLIETAPQCEAISQWLQYAQIMHSVDAIDGVPIPRPTKKAHVREIAKKLGNDGVVAVHAYLFGAAQAVEPEKEAEAIKN